MYLGSIVIAVLALVSVTAQAGQVASRAQLGVILGGAGTLETFEGLPVANGGQLTFSGGVLNSSTVIGGAANRVEAGVNYVSPTLYLEGNGYFALNSKTLGDSTAWRGLGITIDYTAPVNAFGFDLQGYVGYGRIGTVSVYDTGHALLGTMNSVNGGFFGWENAAGIGSVVVAATDSNSYLMIDDHAYGVAAAVPEPETYALMLGGLGIVALLARRRTG